MRISLSACAGSWYSRNADCSCEGRKFETDHRSRHVTGPVRVTSQTSGRWAGHSTEEQARWKG